MNEKKEIKQQKTTLPPEVVTEKRVGHSAAGFALAMIGLGLLFTGGLVYIPFVLAIIAIVQTALGMKVKKQPYTALNAVALPTSIVTLVTAIYCIIRPYIALAIIFLVLLVVGAIYVFCAMIIVFVLSGSALAASSEYAYLALLF